MVGARCARVHGFPIMVEIRNGGPQWQMWTKEEGRSALSVTTVARTARIGSAVVVTPATAMVSAGLAETTPIAESAGAKGAGVKVAVGMGTVDVVKAAVGTGTVVVVKAADAVRAGTAAEETVAEARVADATGTVAGVAVVCATTVPTRAARASARTAWRRRSWSLICRRAWKSPTWTRRCCRI